MKKILVDGKIERFETDILLITTPDEYSCEVELLEDEDNPDRECANLSKNEVLELATTLLDIYKNMKE